MALKANIRSGVMNIIKLSLGDLKGLILYGFSPIGDQLFSEQIV